MPAANRIRMCGARLVGAGPPARHLPSVNGRARPAASWVILVRVKGSERPVYAGAIWVKGQRWRGSTPSARRSAECPFRGFGSVGEQYARICFGPRLVSGGGQYTQM